MYASVGAWVFRVWLRSVGESDEQAFRPQFCMTEVGFNHLISKCNCRQLGRVVKMFAFQSWEHPDGCQNSQAE